MCRVLSVSPSGYYAWRDQKPSKRPQARAALDAKVKVAFVARKGCEGGRPDCRGGRAHPSAWHGITATARHQPARVLTATTAAKKKPRESGASFIALPPGLRCASSQPTTLNTNTIASFAFANNIIAGDLELASCRNRRCYIT